MIFSSSTILIPQSGFHGKIAMKKRNLFVILFLILVLCGCSKNSSQKEYQDSLIENINISLCENKPEIIISLLSDEAKNTSNIDIAVKKLSEFVPGKYVKAENSNNGILRKSIKDSNSIGGFSNIYMYKITYQLLDDQNNNYFVTVEYMKKNKVVPKQEGVNFISIIRYDENTSTKECVTLGNAFE